eukprot:7111505-Lingulodinium_polyedra.AAC.1
MRPNATRPAGAVQWGGIGRAKRRSPSRKWRTAGAGGSGLRPLRPTQRGGRSPSELGKRAAGCAERHRLQPWHP